MGQQSHLAWALTAVGLLLSSGCVDEHADGDSVGETSEPVEVEEPCLECLNQAWACECKPFNGPDPKEPIIGFFCWSGPEVAVGEACNLLCGTIYGDAGYYHDALPLACAPSTSIPVSCTDWDPQTAIVFASRTGIYEVDQLFLAELVADPLPLWGCDTATVLALEEGGFMIDGPREADLLYLLGLRDGDLIVALNDYDLNDYQDVVHAFTDLWLRQSEAAYTLEIERDGRLIQFDYILVDGAGGAG